VDKELIRPAPGTHYCAACDKYDSGSLDDHWEKVHPNETPPWEEEIDDLIDKFDKIIKETKEANLTIDTKKIQKAKGKVPD